MIDKKNLFIRIIDHAPDIKYRVEHTEDGDMVVHEKPESEWKDETTMIGGITINGKLTKFYVSLTVWNAVDYVQQWNDALCRLDRYGQACLVADVVADRLTAVAWWLLYNVKGKIYMQYHLYCESPYKEAIKNGLFTPETCYDFIPPRATHEDDGEEIREWVLGDVDYAAYETDYMPVKGIEIKIIDKDEDSAFCRLYIGDFYETFEIEDCCWSLEDYALQWKQGLERLRAHDTSCLVISASGPDCGHFINWWLLHKKNGIVYASNQIVLEHIYEEIIGTNSFTVENCYDFIPVEEDDLATSTIYVKHEDLL